MLETLSSFGKFHVEQTAESQSLASYNQSIQEVTESISIVNSLSQELAFKTAGFTDIFRVNIQPTRTIITSDNWKTLQANTRQQILKLKNDIEAIRNELSDLQEKSKEIIFLKQMLSILNRLQMDIDAMKNLKKVYIGVASIPHRNFASLEIALSNVPLILDHCVSNEEVDFVCFAVANKHRPEIERILKIHHGDLFQFPMDLPYDINQASKIVNTRLKETNKREEHLISQLKKIGDENQENFAVWTETNANILAMLEAKRQILQTGRLAVVKGFVPKDGYSNLSEKINNNLTGKALVLQNGFAPEDDPPTKVKHNRFVRPFEEITQLYGLPHYDELDPTLLLAITFPLIFGLMFGDIGHGLVLLVGGASIGFLIKKGQTIKNVCWILASCGIGSIVAGAMFGEFFGVKLFEPLWFSPFENVLSFLIFSLIVGVIQIASGQILEIANFVMKRNFVDAALVSLPKIGFYIGSVYLIATYQLNFGAWFSGPVLFALVPFFLLVFAKPAFAAIAYRGSANKPHREHGSLMESLFEGGDLVTRLLSNTMSYSRILALLMAHWALILVVYTVAGLVGSASTLTLILSGIIVVAGNVFVIALEGLIVFIHTMRLHFYEWFSKFYLGTGTPFKPFEQKYVYTRVNLGKKQV